MISPVNRFSQPYTYHQRVAFSRTVLPRFSGSHSQTKSATPKKGNFVSQLWTRTKQALGDFKRWAGRDWRWPELFPAIKSLFGIAHGMADYVARGASLLFCYTVVTILPNYKWLQKNRLIKPMKQYLERHLVFAPVKVADKYNLKDEKLVDAIEEVGIRSLDDKHTYLEGWYIAPQKGKPTFLLAHGRHCNISYFENLLKLLKEKGYGAFAINYRGFGNSEGTPNEQGVYQDLEAAAQYLEKRRKTPFSDQILLGHSLGGAIASEVATKYPFKAVILCSTFTRLIDAANYAKKNNDNWTVRLMTEKFFGKALSYRFDTIDKIPRIQSPLLLVHGDKDIATNPNTPKQLAEKVSPSITKHVVTLKDVGHLVKE